MVFNANLVAVIKHKGRILRETRGNGNSITNDRVFIPFGAEYTVLLKNLHTKKALVTVEIDGREAISDMIVHPNSSAELERFFESDMNKGHKFKFIEKTDDIRNHRGDKVEDGIVRITYQFEQPEFWYRIYSKSWPNWPDTDLPEKRWPYIFYEPFGNFVGSSGDGTTLGNTSGPNCDIYSNNSVDHSQTFDNLADQVRSVNYCSQVNEDGITVEGDYSNQSFTYGNIGALEPEVHCINIEMKGHKPNKGPVQKPVTVKTKLKCDYCGRMNRSRDKFCPNCGAALI